MNKERILALAALIEKQPHAGPDDERGFNMGIYTHGCGTPACIAGWAASMAGDEDATTVTAAKGYLGLTDVEGMKLFLAMDLDDKSLSDITPSEAAEVLRNMAKTDKIDWSPAVRRGGAA